MHKITRFVIQTPQSECDGMSSSDNSNKADAARWRISTDGRIRLPYYYEDIADHPPVDLLLHGVMGSNWDQPYNTKPVI